MFSEVYGSLLGLGMNISQEMEKSTGCLIGRRGPVQSCWTSIVVLHMNVMFCVLGRVRDPCLRARKSLSLHKAPALYEHDWLWYKSLRSWDNTEGLVSLFVILLCQVRQLIQYQHACVLVYPRHTVKDLLWAQQWLLTGAPGAPGGPKIAPPLWNDIFNVVTIYFTVWVKHILTILFCQTDWRQTTRHPMDHKDIITELKSLSLYLQLVQTAHPIALHIWYTLKHNQQ